MQLCFCVLNLSIWTVWYFERDSFIQHQKKGIIFQKRPVLMSKWWFNFMPLGVGGIKVFLFFNTFLSLLKLQISCPLKLWILMIWRSQFNVYGFILRMEYIFYILICVGSGHDSIPTLCDIWTDCRSNGSRRIE